MVKLGDRVQDKISKQKGIVVAITTWLYGCVRICVQPETTKDGKPAENFAVDEPQCEVIKKGVLTTIESIVSQKITHPVKHVHGNRNDSVAQSRV